MTLKPDFQQMSRKELMTFLDELRKLSLRTHTFFQRPHHTLGLDKECCRTSPSFFIKLRANIYLFRKEDTNEAGR